MASAQDTQPTRSPPVAVTLGGPLRRVLDVVVPRALCLLAVGLVALAAGRAGGYFPVDYLLVGVIALVGAAVGLLVVGDTWRPAAPAVVGLGSLLGLAAFTGLSAGWSPDPGDATLAMARCLVYAGALLLSVLAVAADGGRHARLLLRGLVAVLVGISVLALVGRVRADLFDPGSAVTFPPAGRLGSIITYWNGLGAITAMAIMGAIGLAADARERLAVRALAAAGGVLAGGTLYLTLSRGSGLALAVALVVVLALSPRRARIVGSAALVLVGGIGVVLVLRHHPLLIDAPGTQAAREAAGRRVVAPLLAIAAATAALQVLLGSLPRLARRATGSRGGTTTPHGPRVGSTASTVLAIVPFAVVLVALVGGYLVIGSRAERGANSHTGGVRSFIDRQYTSFMNPLAEPAAGQARLGTIQSSRSDAYRVALDGFLAHPLAGDGAAGYHVRWYRQRRGFDDLRNAHSLELETLDELGLVGACLLLGLLGSLASGLRSMLRRSGPVTRTQGAAASGILVVWLVHSAIDWDWQLPAVTLPALVAGALCLASDRPAARGRRRRRRSSRRRAATA